MSEGAAGQPEGGGVTVLDGAALVAGAAVASVHVRDVVPTGPVGSGWAVVLLTFLWVALTAAGPFLFLVRSFVRRLPGYPKVGDWLWAMLGLPWLLAAAVRNVPAASGGELVSALLSIGLAGASVVAVGVVWATWVMVSPQKAAETFSAPWTNRVGLCLAVAWPIQCGVGLVVIG
jgi:hypothetical protein